YYTASVVNYPLVASSAVCCEGTSSAPAPAAAPRAAPRPEADERTPSASAVGESISSEVTPPNENPKAAADRPAPPPGSRAPPAPASGPGGAGPTAPSGSAGHGYNVTACTHALRRLAAGGQAG